MDDEGLSFAQHRRRAIARALKKARNQSGLTAQEVVGKLAVRGIRVANVAQVYAWEMSAKSGRPIRAHYLPALAAIYGCKVADFLVVGQFEL